MGGSGGLSPRFMLRVAALPIEAVHGLRCPGSRRWAQELLTEEERLADLGARLSDPLAELVKAATDDQQRRQLLTLRRQVFNNRLPRELGPARALADTLAGTLTGTLTDPLTGQAGGLLAQWLEARVRLDELRAAGSSLFAEELNASRAELRKLAGRDELHLGLLLASPTLEGKLDAFVAAPSTAPDKRARKMERSLLSYLYRTACKTSPFSTFTTVAPGTFTDSAEFDTRSTGHPRLNVVVLARLAELIAADPERRRDLPVALASGWVLDEERVRYVRRSVTAGDDSAAVSFDAAQDRLFFLRLSDALEQMLELFRTRSLIRHRELSALLSGRAGASTEEAEHYLTALIDLGMLQLPLLATDVHSHDPLNSFQRALRSLQCPWADGIALRLAGPAACLTRYPGADVPTRRALLASLRRELLALQSELGAESPSLPQTVLYEDVVGGPVQLPSAWVEPAAESLRSLTRILPAFDVALAQRLTLKGFFLVRHGKGGRCEDLLQLVHDFHEDIFHQYLQFTATKPATGQDGGYPAEENWLGMPEVTALDRARSELSTRMRQLWADRPDSAEELVLDESAVAAVAAELAPLGRGFAPHSHFVQLARREGEQPGTAPLGVLNSSYGGLCFPFTRFTHCFDSEHGLPAELRSSLEELQPPGAVFAEVTAGSATTNLNLHTRLTRYEICCPGETSTAPEEDRIQLDDLYVEHEPGADRLVLRSRRLEREVVPLYLGYLVPMVLPEIPRTLLLFSPTSRVTPEVWRGVPTGPAIDGVTHRPRVRLGDLILQRRCWTAGSDTLPAALPGEDESERFLRWRRWQRGHRLPDQVFARVRPQAGDGPGGGWFGTSKPQYVDFDSPLSLLALDGLIAGRAADVVFEEMLPGADALSVRSAGGRHVAELALEITPDTAPPSGERSHD